jgi:hypothetical protein
MLFNTSTLTLLALATFGAVTAVKDKMQFTVTCKSHKAGTCPDYFIGEAKDRAIPCEEPTSGSDCKDGKTMYPLRDIVTRMNKGKESDRVFDCEGRKEERCSSAWVPWRGTDWKKNMGQKCKWSGKGCVQDVNDFVYCEDCKDNVIIPSCPICTKL